MNMARTTVIPAQRSLVILAQGFSPLLLRPGVISQEIVESASPASIVTPVLSQLRYPSGFNLILTEDKFQVVSEGAAAQQFEALADAALDFLNRNELVQYRALGWNISANILSDDNEYITSLYSNFVNMSAFSRLTEEHVTNTAVELVFSAYDGKCQVRIEGVFSETRPVGMQVRLNLHYDLAGWKDLRKLLKDATRGQRVFDDIVHRLISTEVPT